MTRKCIAPRHQEEEEARASWCFFNPPTQKSQSLGLIQEIRIKAFALLINYTCLARGAGWERRDVSKAGALKSFRFQILRAWGERRRLGVERKLD